MPTLLIFAPVGFIAAWLFWVYYRFVKECYDQDRETRKNLRVKK